MMKCDMNRPPHTAWRKSSHSGSGDNINCIEVAFLSGNRIAVRDSKNPDNPKLTFTNHEWAHFLKEAAIGKFQQN
jgi:hypothetical protein